MPITAEMEEIISYLSGRDDYAIFAGFAAFLHTGVEPSPDIDILIDLPEKVGKIMEDFLEKGWKRICYSSQHFVTGTVKNHDTTLDICFSPPACHALLPGRTTISYEGTPLLVITPEALFLTKMNQLTSPLRTDAKTARDRQVIEILRKKIEVSALRELLDNLEDSFWTLGWY
ncbi:MAG: hypothetical protein HXS51_06765 [Theionarchaea archaeon]|nr:hypothetical protein [Theionarchaea archaeon]MBU7000445.1 hypothetical protein [Theionarchaea archaeon]